MGNNSSATVQRAPALSSTRSGLGWGLLGVTAFSFTVPFTRVVVSGGMSPLFAGSARAVIAALLAGVALVVTKQRVPRGGQWPRLAVVGGGVVVGFPVLTSFALTSTPASHGAVVIALLPAVTAVLAVLRSGERPPRAFWAMAAVGAVAAVVFAVVQGGGIQAVSWADVLLFGAVVAAAIGYAEGGLLARDLGAWQTMCWALVLSAPLTLVLGGFATYQDPPSGTVAEWAAFGYLAVVSALLGFVAWYRGLAIGPMARISQVQLVQPVLGVCWAVLLLDERLTWSTVLGAVAVIASAGVAVRSRFAATGDR